MWILVVIALPIILVLSALVASERGARRQVEREWDQYVAARGQREALNKELVAAGQRPIPGGGRPEYPSWRKAGGRWPAE